MKKTRPLKPILLIDDEEQFLFSMQTILNTKGYNNVETCSDSSEAMKMISASEYSLIIMDIMMPHINGLDLLPDIIVEYPGIPVIMLTAVDEVETAVECMKSGAFDYIVKPIDEEYFFKTVAKALEMREIRIVNRNLKQSLLNDKVNSPENFNRIITRNKKMLSLFKYAEAVAKSGLPVLITGETGTGKELFAEAIHLSSSREGEFIAVNIAGLDDNLFSDTLFGHEKGAFTGAASSRKGLIEKAAGGTVFLDEIGDLSMESQVKLLRLLQEKKYLPLGSDRYKMSDARIIVATNINLRKHVDDNKFRKDLYYRLYSHQIHLPPLRERKDDVPLLLDHFIEKSAEHLGRDKPAYPRELELMLKNYTFPGNIRELEAIIFDAVTIHEKGMLSTESIREKIGTQMEDDYMQIDTDSEMIFPESLPTLREIENMLIDEALQRAENNQTIAAKLLGISRQALHKRLKRR